MCPEYCFNIFCAPPINFLLNKKVEWLPIYLKNDMRYIINWQFSYVKTIIVMGSRWSSIERFLLLMSVVNRFNNCCTWDCIGIPLIQLSETFLHNHVSNLYVRKSETRLCATTRSCSRVLCLAAFMFLFLFNLTHSYLVVHIHALGLDSFLLVTCFGIYYDWKKTVHFCCIFRSHIPETGICIFVTKLSQPVYSYTCCKRACK